MDRERWRKIERLYDAALERDSSERAQFLAEACVGDESLLREVEALLAQGEGPESFLGKPALDGAADAQARDQRRGQARRTRTRCWARRFPITASWRNWAAAGWEWFIRPRIRSSRAGSP